MTIITLLFYKKKMKTLNERESVFLNKKLELILFSRFKHLKFMNWINNSMYDYLTMSEYKKEKKKNKRTSLFDTILSENRNVQHKQRKK